MLQVPVRDVDAWWTSIGPATRPAEFGIRPPVAPATQGWGLEVGFLFDRSGVLWHVAEAPF